MRKDSLYWLLAVNEAPAEGHVLDEIASSLVLSSYSVRASRPTLRIRATSVDIRFSLHQLGLVAPTHGKQLRINEIVEVRSRPQCRWSGGLSSISNLPRDDLLCQNVAMTPMAEMAGDGEIWG